MASSKAFPMLKLRGKWYSYRKRIPDHLRPQFGGRREIVVSLKTQDEAEARIRVLRIAHETEMALQRARGQYRRFAVDPQAIAQQYRQDILRFDQEDRMARPRTDESLEAELDALTSAVEEHRAALQKGNLSIVASLLKDVLDRHQLHLASPVQRQLAHALLREHSQALETALNRALGQWRGESVKPVSPLVSQVLETWLKERKLPSKTEAEVRRIFDKFIKVCGEDKPIADVTKGDVRTFREAILGEPARHRDTTRSSGTIRKYMVLLGAMFSYARKVGFIEQNPVSGMAFVAKGKVDLNGKRQPFTSEGVKTLLEHLHKEPNKTRWWIANILFHSGMRLEEAGGLRGRDVKQVDSVWGFSLEPSEGRSLKTSTAARFVPLHPVLIDAGLVELAKQQGKDWLFKLRTDKHGTRTSALSKQYGRILRLLKLDQGGKVVMHSARHTVATMLRAGNVPEDVRDYLLGHSGGGSIGRQYGTAHPVSTLQKAIASIQYEGVKLSS